MVRPLYPPPLPAVIWNPSFPRSYDHTWAPLHQLKLLLWRTFSTPWLIQSWRHIPSPGEKNMLALEITSYHSVSIQTSCDGKRNILKTFTGIRRVMFYWFATTKWTLPVSSFLPRENRLFAGKSQKREYEFHIFTAV